MKKKYNNPLVVAITGGIGSGQTTAAKLFEKWGAKEGVDYFLCA